MTTQVDALEDAECEAFTNAYDALVRAQRRTGGRFNRASAVPELSRAQYVLLEPLVDSEVPLTVGDLAEAAGVSAPTATRMLDGLVARDIADRRPNPRDRRSVLVGLTAHGRELVEAKHARTVAARAAIFEKLEPGERRHAAELLERLAEAIVELEL